MMVRTVETGDAKVGRYQQDSESTDDVDHVEL